jgi:DNA-binding CsgD family transcriptional regulator
MAFGAVAAGDMVSLRGFITQIAELLRTLDGIHEDPGWLWWTAVALASGEGRYDAAVRLAGAAQSIAERDGLYLHEQLRRQVLPWLERARAQIGPAKTGALSTDGARLRLDELLDEALREPSDDESHAALTPRELEIADLVAAGLTNREIAQRLVISRRTVESHVDHIKRKLGFARRARIVAWVLGREPDDSLSR